MQVNVYKVTLNLTYSSLTQYIVSNNYTLLKNHCNGTI